MSLFNRGVGRCLYLTGGGVGRGSSRSGCRPIQVGRSTDCDEGMNMWEEMEKKNTSGVVVICWQCIYEAKAGKW